MKLLNKIFTLKHFIHIFIETVELQLTLNVFILLKNIHFILIVSKDKKDDFEEP